MNKAPELSFSVRFDSSMICNYIISHLMRQKFDLNCPAQTLHELEGNFSIIDNESSHQFGTMSMKFGFDSLPDPGIERQGFDISGNQAYQTPNGVWESGINSSSCFPNRPPIKVFKLQRDDVTSLGCSDAIRSEGSVLDLETAASGLNVGLLESDNNISTVRDFYSDFGASEEFARKVNLESSPNDEFIDDIILEDDIRQIHSEHMVDSVVESTRIAIAEYAKAVGVKPSGRKRGKPSSKGSRDLDSAVKTSAIKCSQCDFKTTNESNMQRHHRNAHQNSFVHCSLCSYSSRMRARLREHYVRKHKMDKSTTKLLVKSAKFSKSPTTQAKDDSLNQNETDSQLVLECNVEPELLSSDDEDSFEKEPEVVELSNAVQSLN